MRAITCVIEVRSMITDHLEPFVLVGLEHCCGAVRGLQHHGRLQFA